MTHTLTKMPNNTSSIQIDAAMPALEELSEKDVMNSEIEGLSDDTTASAERPVDDDPSMTSDSEEDAGEWQDEKCLQPSERRHGVSPRCNACKHIFSQTHPFGIGVAEPPGSSAGLRFLRSLQVLELSARTGCAFCKLVFARIRRESWKFKPAEAVKIKFELHMHAGTASPFLVLSYNHHASPRTKAIRSRKVYLDLLRERGR